MADNNEGERRRPKTSGGSHDEVRDTPTDPASVHVKLGGETSETATRGKRAGKGENGEAENDRSRGPCYGAFIDGQCSKGILFGLWHFRGTVSRSLCFNEVKFSL